MKDTTNNGITLVALVITIIILLILAGISVTMLTGENGIVNKANHASVESRKAAYEEEQKLIQANLLMDKKIYNWSTKKYMDEYQNELEKKELFADANIVRKDDETIEVTTKEGDVFIITENNIEYIGTKGENVPPSLQESDIEFEAEPSKWTNTDVTVKIKSNIEGYKLQYSLDGTNWENYDDKGILVTENRAIYARLFKRWDKLDELYNKHNNDR